MRNVIWTSIIVVLGWIVMEAGGATLQAQQLSVSASHQQTGEWVGDVRLRQDRDMVQVHTGGDVRTLVSVADLAVSPNRKFWGVVERGQPVQVRIFDDTGAGILEHDLEFVDASDETLSLTILNNGTYVVRDNVANFTRHDLDGSILVRHSNFSGTTGGERPSVLVTDPFGLTSLYVIPEIQYGSERGSMVRLLEGLDQEPRTVLDLSDRTIEYSRLAAGGAMALMVVQGASSSDRSVRIVDRFGNMIQTVDTGEAWMGGSIDESGEIVTLHTTSRVQSFRIDDVNRLGSSTVRGGEVQFAGYCPAREEMVILTGERARTGQIDDAAIQVVSLRERALVRESVPGGSLFWRDGSQPELTCSGTSHTIDGLGRTVQIRPAF